MSAEERAEGERVNVCGLEGSLQDLNGVVLGCDIFEAFRATEVCQILAYVPLFLGEWGKGTISRPRVEGFECL